MLNAKQVNRRASKIGERKYKINQVFHYYSICHYIKIAMRQGEYYFEYCADDLSHDTIDKFEKLGFKIEEYRQGLSRNYNYTFSWYREGK